MPLARGDRLGPYEITEFIGKGGMGEVYRARDTQLKREVALKVLPAAFAEDPERLARFQREAEVVASLDHPNIAPVFGKVESDGVRALALGLVEGPTLADRVAVGALSVEEAVSLAKQIIAALEYAHERGVIHRDLKPANVKVTPDGAVKVLDFGLAKVLDDEPPAAPGADSPTLTLGHTRAGVILGTAAYMSPEQAVGKKADRRSDIFSFGAVLYEMLTGERAFKGDSSGETLVAVTKDEPEWSKLPVGLPSAIEKVLRRCLVKDRKQRLQAIGEARILLESPEEPPAHVPPAPSRALRLFYVSWAVAAVLLVALGTLAFIHFREPAPAPREAVAFTIAPPPNERFLDLQLSPDGRWLALITLASGKPRILLRSLDSLEQRQLVELHVADTRGFWSRDSRYVFFGDASQLKRVDVQGGPPQALSDIEGSLRGGFTTADGRTVFVTGAGRLFQVLAAGGTPERIPRSEKLRVANATSLLPDGVHFLYSAPPIDENAGTYVAALNRGAVGESKRILRDQSIAYYVPGTDSRTGYVLFLRDGSLLAQPFDARKLELSGNPILIAQSVNFFHASASGVIAYVAGGLDRRLSLTWYDRKGNVLGAVGQPAVYVSMALSPDGSQVAVQRADGESIDLWLLASAPGSSSDGATRFTFDKPNDMCPIWSPDGRYIAFASSRHGPQEMYRKQSTGAGGDELLVKSQNLVCPMDFSPDGRLLLYEDVPAQGSVGNLWVLPLEGDRKPFQFHKTEFSETNAKFSPDGKWIAYQSTESGRVEVYVRPFEGKEASGEKLLISSNGGGQPRWTRDGKQIIYASLDNKLMAVDVSTSPSFKKGAPQLLFAAPMNNVLGRFHHWDMTRDAQRFLIETTGDDNAAAPVTVVLNWQARLNK